VAQGVGPEFKPQYHLRKKKKNWDATSDIHKERSKSQNSLNNFEKEEPNRRTYTPP
jgi:hypothetical protein